MRIQAGNVLKIMSDERFSWYYSHLEPCITTNIDFLLIIKRKNYLCTQSNRKVNKMVLILPLFKTKQIIFQQHTQ